MSVRIEEFVAHLGWEVDGSELENFNSQLKDTVAFFAKAAAAIAGATVALTAFTVATNRQTSIQTQLAEAYDISAESAENWGFLLGAVGLEANNVIRAAKDLNVRLGQAFSGIGDASTIKDAVKSLGLEFESLRDLKPEQQFRTILQAAKDLDNGQIALAASQQLLGRQGAIVTGFLRDQKGTIEELLIAIENKSASQQEVDNAIEQISDLLEPAYRFCDNFLQEMISFKKYQNAYFIICSDHGFSFYPGGYNHYNLPENVPAPPGILMIKGPDVRRGLIKNAKIYDIAPTILSLYDLPVGKGMDGRVLNEVFQSSRKITYKRYPLKTTVARDDRINQQNMKELRQLGYVGQEAAVKKKKEKKK